MTTTSGQNRLTPCLLGTRRRSMQQRDRAASPRSSCLRYLRRLIDAAVRLAHHAGVLRIAFAGTLAATLEPALGTRPTGMLYSRATVIADNIERIARGESPPLLIACPD